MMMITRIIQRNWNERSLLDFGVWIFVQGFIVIPGALSPLAWIYCVAVDDYSYFQLPQVWVPFAFFCMLVPGLLLHLATRKK